MLSDEDQKDLLRSKYERRDDLIGTPEHRDYQQAHIGAGPVASVTSGVPQELVIALVCETARVVGGMVPVARD